MEKKESWVKPRHKLIRDLFCPPFGAFCRHAYHIEVEPFDKQDRQYLILLNHQTPFDQVFVGMVFKRAIYYVATEDIFSNGLTSKLLTFAVAPIPIKKQMTDAKAVKTCFRIVREGGTIAIAPEGNRTYSGRTCYMNPAIARMAKKMKLPVAIFRIEGGYGAQPRWSDAIRSGKMHASVTRVIEPEELAALSNDEVMDIIRKELDVDEACLGETYTGSNLAEYMERCVYVCPWCGLSKFESHGDLVECLRCRRKIRYKPTKELEGLGFEFPFRFVGDWYDYQCDYVNGLDTRELTEKPVFEDEAKVSEVIVYQRKVPLVLHAHIRLYGDRVTINEGESGEMRLDFSDVAVMSCLGRNKLNIYYKDKIYQFKGDKHFNALKYVNFYYRNKNITRGDPDGEFLGL